jgi:mannose-6-phosphate isomerase
VLRASPQSLVYTGLRAGIGAADFRNALRGGTLPEVMHAYAPRPGDCIFLEAGTIHAIGAGLTLFEVQQTSDITYRLYDWGRVDGKTGKPRPLHIEQALACVNVERGPCNPVTPRKKPGQARERLTSCRYFTLDRIRSDRPLPVGAVGQCRILAVVEGRGELRHGGRGEYPLRLGDVLLLPASIGPGVWAPAGAATILECGIS